MQSKNCCPSLQISASANKATPEKEQHHKKEEKKPQHKHKKCKKGSINNICYEKQDCIQSCSGASHGQKLAFFDHGVKKLAQQREFVPATTPSQLYSIVLPTRYRPPIA
ncbi:MAG: hypothetical protein ACRC9R_08275 [Enterovibrio sp.]